MISQLLMSISLQSWLSHVRRWVEECIRAGIRNQSTEHQAAARTRQGDEQSQSDTLLTNMSDQNGVPRRDRFMKTAIFCSRTASPQTQYYPHAPDAIRQPFQDQTLSQNIQTTKIWTTISSFASQRMRRLSRSRLTDTGTMQDIVTDCLRGQVLMFPQCLGSQNDLCLEILASELEFCWQFFLVNQSSICVVVTVTGIHKKSQNPIFTNDSISRSDQRFKKYLKYTFKNEKSFYFHRHLASWWRLIHYLCWWQHLTDERSPGPTSVTWLWVSCIKSG